MSERDRHVLQAIVAVKAFWAAVGQLPLGVELCAGAPEAEADAWRREAERFLQHVGACNRFGRAFNKHDFVKGHPLPDWWQDLAGEIPGIDDPILSKEIKWGQKHYMSGPVRQTEIALSKPVLS